MYCSNNRGLELGCIGYKNGRCISIENCAAKESEVMSNGMTLFKYELPTESKAYLVQFHMKHHNDHIFDWFEVIHFQAKCKKWKRLNNCAYAWCELPKAVEY